MLITGGAGSVNGSERPILFKKSPRGFITRRWLAPFLRRFHMTEVGQEAYE